MFFRDSSLGILQKMLGLTFASICWSSLMCSSTCLSSVLVIMSMVSFPVGNMSALGIRQQLSVVCPVQATVVSSESVLVRSLSPFTKPLSNKVLSFWVAVLALWTDNVLSLHSNWFCATTPLAVRFCTSWDWSVLCPCFCSGCWMRNFGWGDDADPCFPWDLATLRTEGSFFSSLGLDRLRRMKSTFIWTEYKTPLLC